MLGAVLLTLLGVAMMYRSIWLSRFFFSSAASEQSTAFCWRLRDPRRWVAPLLNTCAVILAMCAIVAFGAVSMVYATTLAVLKGLFVGDRDAAGVARFVFSIRGVLDGL